MPSFTSQARYPALRIRVEHLKRYWRFYIASAICTFVLASIFVLVATGFDLNSSLWNAFLFGLLPNVFSSAALYFFSPDAFSLTSDIVKFRKTNDVLIKDLKAQRHSTYPIRILDTRITNLMETIDTEHAREDWFEEELRRTILEHRNEVIILLTNPFAEFALQRAKDKGMDPLTYMEGHLRGLFKLNSIRARLGSLRKLLDVRLFDTMPPPAIHIFQDHGYVTFYPPVGVTDDSDAIRFKCATEFGGEIIRLIHDVYIDNNTIDLDELVYCTHLAPHGPMRFLYSATPESSPTGYNTYGREPRYLLIAHSDTSARYLTTRKSLEFTLGGLSMAWSGDVRAIDRVTDGDRYHSILQEIRTKYFFEPAEFDKQYRDPILLEIVRYENKRYR